MTTPDSNLKLNNPAQGSTTSNVNPKPDAVNETPIEKKKPTSLFNGLKREDIVDNQKLLDEFDKYDTITKNGILDQDEFRAYSIEKQAFFKNNWVGLNRKEIEESFLEGNRVREIFLEKFDKLDTDKDGTITQQEYQSAFGKGDTRWINTLQINGEIDGQLNLNDFNDVEDFSAELLNMAKKADTNNDGILTVYEWQVFTLSKKLYAPEISKENATMLEGLNGGKITKNLNNILNETKDGVYTAKKGETIESIAKKFGISRIDLCLNNNISVTTNTLEEGAQLKITGIRYYGNNYKDKLEKDDNLILSIINANSKEEKLKKLSDFYKKNSEDKNSKVLLFEGMTREQAEKIGGDTLLEFYNICKGTDVVTHELYQLYLGRLSTFDKNKMMLIAKDIIGDDIGADDLKLIFNTIVSNLQDTVIDKNSTTAEGAVLKVTMKYAKELTADNAIEYSRNFYREIKDLIDKDKTSENGAYNYHLQRLKSGKFSDFEKNKLGLQGELTDEQAAKYAEIAAKAEFIVPVLESLELAVNENSDGKNDEKIMLFISGLGKEFFEEPSVSAIVKAYGLENIVDKMKRKIVANHFATTDKESFEELDPVAAGVYVNAIAKNADADAYQVFVENHADDVEFIQEVTNIVINNLPDGEQKTALQNAINKAVENISNGTVSSSNNSTKSSNTTNSTYGYSTQGRTQTPTVNDTNYYATSPIMSPNAQSITELKEAAARYNNQISAPTAVHPTQTFKTELEKFMDEMHTKGAVMKAKFENMPLGQALSMVCDNINKIPEQLRGPFIEKFTQMMIIKANSHKDLMCKAYITGSENLRQFMNKNNIITEHMIYDFFDKNESEIKFASKTLQVNYYKHKTEEQIKS